MLLKLFPLSICLLFVVAAGSATEKQSKSGPVTDYPGLIKSLRALGAGVEPAGEVDQPFFSIKGRMIKVHGEDVQVFQYANAAAADAETAPISRDGTAVGTRKIHWIGSPHFYKKEKLLVLYVGDNDKVQRTLEAVLGRQFAGK